MFVRNLTKRFAAILMTTCLFAVTSASAGIGSLQDFEGNARTIEEYTGQGHWLLVMYWAADCHVCNIEAPKFVDFHERHKDSDARVLGVTLDGSANKAAAEAFLERHELNFVNLIGEPEKIATHYLITTQEALRGTPSFLLFDPQGTLRANQAGMVSVEAVEKFMQRSDSTRATPAP